MAFWRSSALFCLAAALVPLVSCVPNTQVLTPEALEQAITETKLKSRIKQLQNIANRDAAHDTRVFGSYGYNESVCE